MTDDVKIKIRLIDEASQGLSKLEQKLRDFQHRAAEQAKLLGQETTQAAAQSNQKQLSGFQRLAQRERELREQAANEAKRLAQETTQAAAQSNAKQLSGFQRLAQREREIREQAANEAKRLAQEAAQAAAQRLGSFQRLAQRERQLREQSANEAKRLAQETARAAEHALQQEQQAAARAMQNITNARQRLGVRSHADIQANMERVRGYYRTLAQSGVLSFREQAQAADKLKQRLQALTNEMGNLTAAQKRYGALQTGAGIAGGVIGGVAGTAYAMVQPIKDAMQYDDRLTTMTNTGFRERDVAGRREGKKEIQAAIETAVKDSKGLIDTFGAAQMIDQLMAGGRVPVKKAMDMLPYLTQTAGANAADPLDIARTTNAAYGLKIVKTNDDLKKFWNMSVAAGQESSFELKDQVKFLPEQLAFAKTNGSHGLDAAREVLKLNVTSSGVTGSSDEAGVATSNFLRKQTGSDTQKDFGDYMEEKHKIKGADLISSLDSFIAKGGNSSDFYAKFIKNETEKSPEVIKLRKKLATEKDPDKREVLESRMDLRKGEIINELFQDVRAVKGVLGSLNTEYGDAVDAKIKAAQMGTFDPNKGNTEFKQDQATAKTTELGNTLEVKKHHALQQSFDTIGSTSQKANEFAGEHSTLATVMSFAPQIGAGVGTAGMGWMGARWLASRAVPAAAEAGVVAAPTLAANTGVALSRFTGLLSQAGSAIARTSAWSAIARTPAATVIGNTARSAAPWIARAANPVAKLAGAASLGYLAGDTLINPVINKMMGPNRSLGAETYNFTHSGASNMISKAGSAASLVNPIVMLGNLFSKFMGKSPAVSDRLPRVDKSAVAAKIIANPMGLTSLSASPLPQLKAGGALSKESAPFNALSNVIAKLNGSESSLSSSISNLMSWKPEPLPVEVNTQSHLTVALAAGLVVQSQNSQSSSTAQKGANSSTVNAGSNTGNIFSGTP
jgi:hypothetical protein